MGLQLINTGLTANDGSGDTLRSAGAKINSNFTELYAGVQIPAATAGTLGTVRPDGTSITIDGRGVLSVLTAGSPASTVNLGLVRVDGTTITSNAGLITATPYTLPTATTSVLGGVKVDGTSITITSGVISSILPRATTSVLGGVKVDGTTITINNGTGVISSAASYSLPTASTSVLGGVKVDGSSITINGSGVISSGVSGTVVFKGTWNASTNTPTLASGSGTQGWQYSVAVAGTVDLGNGSKTYGVGDFVIYDGTNWIDIASSSGVTTFNSRAGAVTLTSGDVASALGFTPLQSSSLSIATTTASGGGSLSYAAGTFTFAPASVPTYTITTGTASGGGSLSLTGSTFTFNPAASYTLPTASSSTLGGIKIDNNSIVINNGVISVGGALTSATIFKGSWDASANSPVLAVGTPANVAAGWEYIVSVGGTRDIGNGSTSWSVGDLAIYDGAKWVRIPGGNNVTSFNTRQGAITLTSSDVTTALGFTPIQLSNHSVISPTASGTTSTLSYNSVSGAFTFTSASASSILGGISVASSNGFSGSNSSGAITIQTSITGLLKGNGTAISAATAGTDYQAAISATGLLKSSGVSGNVSAAVAGTDYFAPASTTANYVLAAPNGSAGTPTFRALVAADLPSLTSAQLATILSDETGTGVNVMGTSPTITTSLIAGSASFDLLNTTATTVNFAGAATTATLVNSATTLSIGNTATTAQTVNMFTASTGASTYNFATGATANTTTKAINIGTAGVSGSTTNIVLGSSVSGASGTITHNGNTTLSSGSLTFSGNISAAAWTTNGIRHVSVAATLTDTSSTGTVANAYTNNFGGNTIAASNAVTYTNYGTVFINDPTAGTNVTITNPYSLITAGNVKLGSTGTGTITAVAATATTSSTAASVGYLGSPINTQASTYTLVIGDAGKTIYAGGNLTIPANGAVAFPIGTIVNVIASAGITIAITTDTLQWGGQATSQTGTRTVATYGMVSLVKVAATTWYISGVGVT
jgi:hypothetical protein